MSPEFNFHLKVVADTADDADRLCQFLLKIRGVDQIKPSTLQQTVSRDKIEFLLPTTRQPLTNEMLLDPNFTSEILKACLLAPQIVATDSMRTKVRNSLAIRFGRKVPYEHYEHWSVDGPFIISTQQLLLMNDEILMGEVRNLGPKGVALFRDATRPLVQQFKEVLDQRIP